MSSFEAFQADIVFKTEFDKNEQDIEQLRRRANDAYGQIGTSSLRAATAQDKYDKALIRAGGDAEKTRRANLAYRQEIERLTTATNRENVALDRTGRELGQVTRGAVTGSGALRGMGRSVAFASSAFLGGAGLVYAIRTALDASSNLAEQTDFVERVFGKSSKTVIDYADNALGFARDQALEAAAGIGSLLVPLGVLPADAAKSSVELAKLAGDLSSLKNTSPAEALTAVRALLVGEYEPARRYAVVLNEASVAQEAMRVSGKKSSDELSARDKVLARINLLMRATTIAQGNYAATIGSTANQEREAQKNLRNTAILIGDTLQPAYNHLLQEINDYIGDAENQKRIQEEVNEVIETGTKVVHGLADAFDVLHDVGEPLVNTVGGVENAVKLLVLAMAFGKVVKFAGALGLIGPAAARAATVSTAATGIEAAGTAALVSTGRVAGLRGALLGLTRVGPIAIPVTLAVTAKMIAESDFGKSLHLDYSGLDLLNDAFGDDIGRVKNLFGGGGGGDGETAFVDSGIESLRSSTAIRNGGGPQGIYGGGTAGSRAIGGALTAAQLRAQALARNPEDVTALQGELEYKKRAAAFLERLRMRGRITNADYLAKYQAIYGDIDDLQGRLDTIAEAAARDAAASAQKRQSIYESSLRVRAKELANAAVASGRFASSVKNPSLYTLPGKTAGMLTRGNIDLANRPIAHNADGSISTVRSISISVDGREVLLPTVINGKVVSAKEAVAHYFKTGEQLGVFTSAEAADAYAERLHEQQEKAYSGGRSAVSILAPKRTAAQDGLVAFYKKAAHDQRLSQSERARYQGLILKENERQKDAVAKFSAEWTKSLAAIKKAGEGLGFSKAETAEIDAKQLGRAQSIQEQIFQNRLAAAGLIADPAKQQAVERRVLQDQVAFWHRLAANETDQLTRLQDQAQELAARQALRQLAKGIGSGQTDFGQVRDSFLSSFAATQGKFGPNAFSLEASQQAFASSKAAGTGASETRLFEAVHELRGIKEHLADIRSTTKFPSSKLAQQERDAAYG